MPRHRRHHPPHPFRSLFAGPPPPRPGEHPPHHDHPHHPHHPPHHHAPHHHPHHPAPGEQWSVNVEETLPLAEVASFLRDLFGQLAERGHAELGEEVVDPGEAVDVLCRLGSAGPEHALTVVIGWDVSESNVRTTSSFATLTRRAAGAA